MKHTVRFALMSVLLLSAQVAFAVEEASSAEVGLGNTQGMGILMLVLGFLAILVIGFASMGNSKPTHEKEITK